MCTYSNFIRDTFPGGPHDPWAVPKFPNPYPNPFPLPGIAPPTTHPMFPKEIYPNMIPWGTVTPDLAKQILKILELLDSLDKRLGNLECKAEEAEKKAIVAKLEGIAKGE